MAFLCVSGSIEFSPNVTDRIKGIYYVAKNLQLSSNELNYVPILVWSDESGWTSNAQTNVIVWPGKSRVPPSGYASVSGVTLRIAVTETALFIIVTQVTDSSRQTRIKLVGYMPDLIELLRTRMGFILIITLVTNQTFNGIVDAVASDVYDMFVAQTTITAVRREEVDFSNSIFDNFLRIITRKESEPDVDFFSILKTILT
jgi:ABC-type amino acid transport substrate-binding protein